MPLSKFHCAACHAPLIGAVDAKVMCDRCDEIVPLAEGILTFAAGDGGVSDVHCPDYEQLRTIAADHWPRMLGSVLQVGGLSLTRALVEGKAATDLVVTDESAAALHGLREHLRGAGLLDDLPVTFATHGGTEDVFRDGAFDTCAGGMDFRQPAETRRFLGSIHRWLRPGGRAFFVVPNPRYRRALGQTLADILLLLLREDPGSLDGGGRLLDVAGQWCRTAVDRYATTDGLEGLGREIGFATATALPEGNDPTGRIATAAIATRLGVPEPLRSTVLGLLPAFAHRYLDLLPERDQSERCVLWLEKGIGPVSRTFRAPPLAETVAGLPLSFLMGGLPPRWSIELTASRVGGGTNVHVSGWCVVNADMRGLRLTIGETSHMVPVVRPRPDVPPAIDPNGAYATPHVLFCGMDETFYDPTGGLEGRIEIELASGAILPVRDSVVLPLDETVVVAQ